MLLTYKDLLGGVGIYLLWGLLKITHLFEVFSPQNPPQYLQLTSLSKNSFSLCTFGHRSSPA
jgi:hypothetical protein